MTVNTVTVIVDGVSTVLTYNSTSGKWEGTINAPSATSGMNNGGSGPGVGASASTAGGYYPVRVIATDTATNSTEANDTTGDFQNVCKLYVTESTAPVASITSPASGANVGNNSTPTITFTITDAGSGVNPNSVVIDIDGTEYAPASTSFNADGTILTCTYTPATSLSDGSHTITVYGYDYDGNKSNEAVSTFKVDTTPPVLNVSYPSASDVLTNLASINVTGSTNDANSSPVTVVITVTPSGGSATTYDNITIGQDGSFSQAVSLTEGSNTIVVTSTDASSLVSTVSRTIELDSTAPVITDIVITPGSSSNPAVVGSTWTISVTVTDS